ncbi:MAG: hypothetical protein C0594_02855 [Marinilabiliales bacterium]|nr:MAG: hypothetical protein C0594_02855 [Marinilabiliales bacterium]
MIYIYILVGIVISSLLFILIFTWFVVIPVPKKRYKLPDFTNEKVHESNGIRRIGNNWFRINKYGHWELFVQGTPIEIGVATGKLTQKQMWEQEEIFFKQIQRFIPSMRLLKMIRLVVAWFNRHIEKHITPEYLEEIYGVSRYASKDFEFIANNYQRHLNLHAAHDIGRVLQDMKLSGCSAFATWGNNTKNGSILHGRNFDFYVGNEFANNKIVSFVRPERGYNYMSVGWGGLIGVVSGMNNQGLSITINGSSSKRPGGAKTPTSILGREILQYAADLESAIKIAEKRELFVSEIFLVSSLKDGRACIIEKTPFKTAIYNAKEDYVAASNHFQTEEFKDEKINLDNIATTDSPNRLNRVVELIGQQGGMTPEKVAEILRNWKGKGEKDIGYGNENALNFFVCHHSVIFDPANQKAWVSTTPYQMGKYVCYDLNKIFSQATHSDDFLTYCKDEEIAEHPFVYTEEFKNFIEFRQNVSPLQYEREDALGKLSIKNIPRFIESNPDLFLVYKTLGDYYLKNNLYLNAQRYYNFALTKEIPTDFDRDTIKKQIEKCIAETKVKEAGYPDFDFSIEKTRKDFIQWKACVIIPTYNNEKTLRMVVESVSNYTSEIIVVNDGSTDETQKILESLSGISVVSYEQNQGKGFALRKGFERALELGFDYAITIDSDAQHMAEDIPLFFEKIKENPKSIIVGARNMNQASVPGKSSFGNKFSNFWFRLETGIKHPDTQSGYRMYPIRKLQQFKFYATKYEFEVEVLVRASWKGMDVTYVPIHVHYGDDRVSHFKMGRDMLRFSLLNTILVSIALLYARPFRFIQELKKHKPRDFYEKYILNSKETNVRIAVAVGFGVFMGIAPVWGWQLVIAITLAHLFKLNKVVVVAAAHISIPPLIPVVLYLSYISGGIVLSKETTLVASDVDFEFITNNLLQYVTGSLVFAGIAAVVFGFFSFMLLSLFRKNPENA